MSLRELRQIVSTSAFEVYGGLRLMEVSWPDRGCRLHFRIAPGEEPNDDDDDTLSHQQPTEDWIVECDEVRASRIMLQWADDLSIEAEHPLVWSYRDGETQLAFHGRPRDPVAVVGALWAAHREVVGTWIPFGQHLNVFDANAPVTSLLETGGGVLAAGPRALLQAYADVLQSHGLETRFLGTYRLGLGEPERPDVAVLLFGMSYVIGAGFSARRHNEPSPAA